LVAVVAEPKLGRCVVACAVVECRETGEVALIAVVFGTKLGGVM
jgi:hypothetical protein